MEKFWQNKNVFVTGGNGFIGGNLIQTLVSHGASVTALVRNQKRNTFLYFEKLDKKINIIDGDLTDKDLLARIISEEQINVVYHLAAQVEVGVARVNPFLTWETNVRGTYCLLEAIRQNSETVKSVVIASSDKAYGSYPKDKMPYQEDYPLIPVFPYDVSKAAADMIAHSYAGDIFKLPIVVTRFCNIYGPGQLNFSAVMPDAIRSALGYSTFIPRGNGMNLRDFIFADDVVKLYLLIGERLANDNTLRGQVFNAGTNDPTLIKDVVKQIYQLVDNPTAYHKVNALWGKAQTVGEIDAQFMNFEKAEKFFGWKPETKFEDGLKKTIQWFKKYLEANAED